jgi:ketosteroid isomerase-like protein
MTAMRKPAGSWLAPALCVLLAACASPGQRPPDAALASAIKAQADAWDAAIVRKDREAIAANMHEDFMAIDSDGGAKDKPGFLAEITDPKLAIDPYTVEDFRARVHGDVVITTGTTRMTGRYDGQPFATRYRYTDTYIRDGDGWKVVQVQTTRIRPSP